MIACSPSTKSANATRARSATSFIRWATGAASNGQGRTGAARAVTRWQAFIVSTGERTIATTMAEGGHRSRPGNRFGCSIFQRRASMAASTCCTINASGAALSDAIKRAAVTHYGRAGRAFLERLTHDQRDFAARLEILKGLPDFNRQDFEGQDKRAAGRFALLALAGELATEYGLTGWPEGEAVKAAAIGFNAWRSLRGRGNDERRQIFNRFPTSSNGTATGAFPMRTDTRESQTRDRAGWWRDTQGGRLYLFTAEGMRDALKGFDFKRALDELEACGAIPKPGADGKRAKLREHRRAEGARLRGHWTMLTGGEHGA
jgi:putative DNA primase/helicase